VRKSRIQRKRQRLGKSLDDVDFDASYNFLDVRLARKDFTRQQFNISPSKFRRVRFQFIGEGRR
jgi:hypothetical protein